MAKKIKVNRWNLLVEIIKDPDRKSLFRIIYELLYLCCVYKELPVHYFSRYLFKKGMINVRNYLPNRFLGENFTHVLNDQKVKEVLDNKLFFDFFFSQHNINIPIIIMYNHKKMFTVGNTSVEVNDTRDFEVLLSQTFDNNPSYDSIFIKKIYSSSKGRDIIKISLDQYKSDPELINRIYPAVVKSEFLFQETVKQHHDLNVLNSSSLNTIRFDTFIDSDGHIDIMSGFIRISIESCSLNAWIAISGVGYSNWSIRTCSY